MATDFVSAVQSNRIVLWLSANLHQHLRTRGMGSLPSSGKDRPSLVRSPPPEDWEIIKTKPWHFSPDIRSIEEWCDSLGLFSIKPEIVSSTRYGVCACGVHDVVLPLSAELLQRKTEQECKKQTNKKTQSSCGSFKNSKRTRAHSAAADYALKKTKPILL